MIGDVSVSLQAGQTVVVINFVDTGIVFGSSWLTVDGIFTGSKVVMDKLFAAVSERDSDSMVLRWVDLGAPETVFRWVDVVSALSIEDLCEVADGLRWGSVSGGMPLVTWLVITVGLTVGLPLILEFNNVV
jgi:hypothetical protein